MAKHLNIRWIGVFCGLFLILQTGCPVGTGNCRTDNECKRDEICREGRCEKASQRKPCQVDDECSISTWCAFDPSGVGECTPTSELLCKEDTECPPGIFCNTANGTCTGNRQGTATCRQDSDCQREETCDLSKGACVVKKNTSCRQDTDCKVTGYCNLSASRCEVRPAGSCKQDSDCKSGQRCQSGDCRSSCSKDADCSQGYRCDTASSLCIAGCRSNAECPGSQICDTSKGLCQSPPTDPNKPITTTCNLGFANSEVLIKNETGYRMSISFSGPSSHQFTLEVAQNKQIEATPGSYTWNASVENPGVKPGSGSIRFEKGCRTEWRFFIR